MTSGPAKSRNSRFRMYYAGNKLSAVDSAMSRSDQKANANNASYYWSIQKPWEQGEIDEMDPKLSWASTSEKVTEIGLHVIEGSLSRKR